VQGDFIMEMLGGGGGKLARNADVVSSDGGV
jgi:hypothetical protein